MEKNKSKTLFSYEIESNQQAHNLSIALGMVGLYTNIKGCELILRALSSMEEMKGNFDLETACKIKIEVDKKYSLIEDKFNNQS